MKRSAKQIARLLRVMEHQKVVHEIDYAEQRSRSAQARAEIEHLYSTADASGSLTSSFHQLFQRRIATLSSIKTESELAAEHAAAALGTQKRRLKHAEQHHRTAKAADERQRAEHDLQEIIERRNTVTAPASGKTGRLR